MFDLGLAKVIGDAVKAGFGLVDDLHTSDEEKLVMKHHLLTIQADTLGKTLDYEAKALEARASIIVEEAKGSWWHPKAIWRPLTMLTFLALVVGYWFGYVPENVSEELVGRLFTLIQIGLGGYIVGRSGEKIAHTIVNKNVT